jgi:uncharacterized protein with PIN domain
VVLDTSACFALLENEAGADVVEAYLLDAVLVHKDPEFDALKGVMKLHPLPPKSGKAT